MQELPGHVCRSYLAMQKTCVFWKRCAELPGHAKDVRSYLAMQKMQKQLQKQQKRNVKQCACKDAFSESQAYSK